MPLLKFFRVEVKVFWVVTLYNAVVGYQHFSSTCCLPSWTLTHTEDQMAPYNTLWTGNPLTPTCIWCWVTPSPNQ